MVTSKTLSNPLTHTHPHTLHLQTHTHTHRRFTHRFSGLDLSLYKHLHCFSPVLGQCSRQCTVSFLLCFQRSYKLAPCIFYTAQSVTSTLLRFLYYLVQPVSILFLQVSPVYGRVCEEGYVRVCEDVWGEGMLQATGTDSCYTHVRSMFFM